MMQRIQAPLKVSHFTSSVPTCVRRDVEGDYELQALPLSLMLPAQRSTPVGVDVMKIPL